MQRYTTRWVTATVVAILAITFAFTAFSQASDEVDTSRLQRAFAKARRGERVTVAVIGGSITAGALASAPEKSYGSLVAQWWRKAFPKADVHFVNAGIGATGSNYGALRASRDVVAHHPDFVVTEYSVNDPNLQTAAESYEGLVRQLLASPGQPAVLMLFMMSDGGRNVQELHSKVGRHYCLPMVSMRDALWPEIEAGRLKWDDCEGDKIHPNDRGHAYTASLVTAYLESVLKQTPTDDRLPQVKPLPPPLFSNLYEHAALFEAGALKPIKNNGWTLGGAGNEKYWKADKPGSRIEFELEGRAILLMDYHLRGPMGRARVQVDDRPPIVREAWFSQTWGGYRQTDELARDLPPGKHRVTIEILDEKNPESTGHEYRVIGLGAAGVKQGAKSKWTPRPH